MSVYLFFFIVRYLVLVFTFVIFFFFYLLFRCFSQWQVVVNSSIWILPVTFEFYFCNRNLSTVLWHYCTDYAHLARSIYWAKSWENMQLHALIVKSKGINYKLNTHRCSYAHISFSLSCEHESFLLTRELNKSFLCFKDPVFVMCCIFYWYYHSCWRKRNFVKGG